MCGSTSGLCKAEVLAAWIDSCLLSLQLHFAPTWQWHSSLLSRYHPLPRDDTLQGTNATLLSRFSNKDAKKQTRVFMLKFLFKPGTTAIQSDSECRILLACYWKHVLTIIHSSFTFTHQLRDLMIIIHQYTQFIIQLYAADKWLSYDPLIH